MTIHSVSLHMQAMQQQVIRLCAQMKTIAQVDHVFELISKLVALSEDPDPVTDALYETVLERRAELLRAKDEKAPPPRSYFPVREKSEKSRKEAATGKRNPERWARKRRLGSREAMPACLSDKFTEGERAALYIVASDAREHGSCRCSNKEIGDRAGVGLTTVRNALRKAKAFDLINVQHREQWRGKNLTNIVTMTCKSWWAWLCRFRPKLGFNYSLKGVKTPMSSETFSKNTERKKSGQPVLYPKGSPSGGFQPFAQGKLSFG